MKKFSIVSETGPLLERLASSVEFLHYRRLLANALKIEEHDLIRHWESGFQGLRKARPVFSGGMTGRVNAERFLISLILEYPDFIPIVREKVSGDDFTEESYRTIFGLLVQECGRGNFRLGRLLDQVADEELRKILSSLSVGERTPEESAKEILNDCLRYLERSRLAEHLKSMTQEIEDAEGRRDEKKILELISEKNALLK